MVKRELVKSGIPGFDKISGGGFLKGSVMTVSGPTGSGKSTFGMQFLYNGASKYGDPGLYISIEQSRKSTLFHMSGYNWDIAGLEKEQKFLFLDYPVYEVEQFLHQYGAIQEIISTTGVKRVVIDSIMPVALYFGKDNERKEGFLKLIDNIRRWGTTTLILSEGTKGEGYGSIPHTKYGIENFTDGWVNLYYIQSGKKKERTRYLEILKMKGSQHSAKMHPLKHDKTGFKISKR